MKNGSRACFGLVSAMLVVLAAPAAAANAADSTAECSDNEKLMASVKDWICAQPFSGPWTDRDGNAYTQALKFDDSGAARALRRPNGGGPGTSRKLGAFEYVVEDRMLRDLDPGVESIYVFLKSTRDVPQPDGSSRRVDTWKSLRLRAQWGGFETAGTDADDVLHLGLVEERTNSSAGGFPLDLAGGALSANRPASRDMKTTVDALLSSRVRCFLDQVVAGDEYRDYCRGRYAAPKGATSAADVIMTFDDEDGVQLEVAGTRPGAFGTAIAARRFVGRLSDIRRYGGPGSVPHNEMLNGGLAGGGTRTLMLDFLSQAGDDWLQVACHYDRNANTRTVNYVVNHRESGQWVPDRFWWPDRASSTNLVEAASASR